MISLTALLLITGAALLISGHALRTLQPYGLVRFVVFESFAVVVALNVPVWFVDPLAPLQLLSWTLLSLSIVLAATGAHALRSRGNPQQRLIEETQSVVDTGIYGLIRHPMYTSLMLLCWGAALKSPGVWQVLLSLVCTAAAAATARLEELHNLGRFGEGYREYMGRTRRFVPYLI